MNEELKAQIIALCIEHGIVSDTQSMTDEKFAIVCNALAGWLGLPDAKGDSYE